MTVKQQWLVSYFCSTDSTKPPRSLLMEKTLLRSAENVRATELGLHGQPMSGTGNASYTIEKLQQTQGLVRSMT